MPAGLFRAPRVLLAVLGRAHLAWLPLHFCREEADLLFLQVVLTPRRTMAEDDGPIPHGPSRVPTGRCCCAGAGGVCFSELDFISMYRANSSHPERFALFSDLRQVIKSAALICVSMILEKLQDICKNGRPSR